MMNKNVLIGNYYETTFSEIARLAATSDRWNCKDGHFLVCGNNRNQINVVLSAVDEYRGLGTVSGKVTLTGKFEQSLSDKLSDSLDGAAFGNGLYLIKGEKKFRPCFCYHDYGNRIRVFVIEHSTYSAADKFRWNTVGKIDLSTTELLDKIEKLEKLAEELLKEKEEKKNASSKPPKPARE